MSVYQRFYHTVRDLQGNAVSGASCTVYNAGTTTLATIYSASSSDSNPIGMSNPFTTGADGVVAFFGLDGQYDVQITGGSMASQAMRITLSTADAGIGAVAAADLADTASLALGDALVGVKQPFTGAVGTTQHAVNSRIVHAKDFGAKFDGVTDDTAAINAATAYAHSLSLGMLVDPSVTESFGGATVLMPPGKAVISGTLNVYEGVTLKGAGSRATLLQSSYNGTIMTNPTAIYGGGGFGLEDFYIVGDRTKASQTGIDLLRAAWGRIKGVSVWNSGGTGIRLRQCLQLSCDTLETIQCVGAGLWISEGIVSRVDTTSNGYPSNNNTFVNGHFAFNDGPGVKITGTADGNVFVGGGSEANYYTGGNNVGYNIEISGTTLFPTEFIAFWTEGAVKSHLYLNGTNIACTVRMTNWRHLANGAAGNVDRAAIVDSGTLIIAGASSPGLTYKTIGGSNAPMRVNKAGGAALIRARDLVGNSVTDWKWCEDTANSTSGVQGAFLLDTMGDHYSPQNWRTVLGGSTLDFFCDTETYAWLSLQNFYRGIGFGSGSAAFDTMLKRTGTRTLGMDTTGGSQFFDQGSAWNGNHGLMGGYHLWVDSLGKLRIKSGAPTSDADGVIVGTQA